MRFLLRRRAVSGFWYAPVLLQRKKALERGTWREPAKPAQRTTAQEKPVDPARHRGQKGKFQRRGFRRIASRKVRRLGGCYRSQRLERHAL